MKPGALANGDRWLSVPPLVRMEGQRCGALGGGSPEGGVCDSLSHASSSVSDSYHSGFVLSPVRQRESFGGGDPGSSPPGSGGPCTSDSGLLQLHVACLSLRLRGGGGGGDYRFVHPEPECRSDAFSNGDFPDCPSFCVEERLDDLHKSEGHIPSDPDPPCVPQVPQAHSGG